MMKEFQVTLISTTGKYKPVSCIVKADTKEMLKVGSTFVKDIQQTDRGFFVIVEFDE